MRYFPDFLSRSPRGVLGYPPTLPRDSFRSLGLLPPPNHSGCGTKACLPFRHSPSIF